jgi:transposase
MDKAKRLQRIQNGGMSKRHFELSEAEIGRLRQQEQQSRDRHEIRRLQAVRLYGSGMSIGTILTIVAGTSESSIRQWAQHYREQGIGGLRSNWQGNNAKKLSDVQRTELGKRLQQHSPQQWGISTGRFWTVSNLEVAVQQWYGVSYSSPRSYVSLLHACGFTYQRAEKVYRSRANERAIADFEAELEKK